MRAGALGDPLHEIAAVACARRTMLIGAHRLRLSREDLEDCYSQATLELLLGARRGRAFSNRRHIANALELRFLSRIHDRRRAIAGRSGAQMALATSVRIGAPKQFEPADARVDVEGLVACRLRLRSVAQAAHRLTDDQRLVLRSQLEGLDPSELCARHGWSMAKYRKLAQRARTRLRMLVDRPACVPLGAAPSDERAGTNL